ncbi:type II toxin-antitoxin system RelE family toxin [Yersinia mollaretii]|uniref:type II toxin-antitoxin system RelE family toxin n=1 Tax=Yersinia mollaretii TaxID=33060 RepID=UPI00119F20FA|nr:type II toxin-antitoxin system RelE/ParE family toxin [Yersinia mollaretii]
MSGNDFKPQLKFKKSAKKEWDALDSKVRESFKKKLKKRAQSLEELKPQKHKLSGVERCYKIKLRSDGYRLVYQVTETSSGKFSIVIKVITVDRREDVYETLKVKLQKADADISDSLRIIKLRNDNE